MSIDATWVRSRRARSIRSTRPPRSSSASHGSSACRRWSSSLRNVPMNRNGTSCRALTRYAIVSRVAASAQCRSSTIRRTGDRAASRSNSPNSASNSRDCTHSDCDGAGSRDPKAGTRRARSSAAGPATAAVSTGPRSSARLRRASTNGPYGRLEPPMLPQSPRSTRNPRSAARRAASLVNRVLPTPASPATSRCTVSPPAARSSALSIVWSSASRPTTTGLLTRVAMSGRIRASRADLTIVIRPEPRAKGRRPHRASWVRMAALRHQIDR